MEEIQRADKIGDRAESCLTLISMLKKRETNFFNKY